MEATAPVTVERAATILGVSPSTIHRRIRSGALRAEQAARPQGAVWLVHLPPDVAAPTEDLPPPTAAQATASAAGGSPADAMAVLIQATLVPIVAPLVAEQAALRQTVERQAERLEAQAETIGRQGAELERAASAVVALNDQLAAAEDARRREHRRLRIGLAVGATLALAAAVAPAWAS